MPNSNGIKIRYSARFLKSAKRLEKQLVKKIKERDSIFRQNPFDSKLDTHKLRGRWEGYWAYSVDFHYRVIFVFEDTKLVTYYNVGPHKIYGGE